MTAPSAKDLITRLPRTFVPAINEKLEGWELLFPAEQRLLTAQLTWLAGLPKSDFDHLFAPVNQVESLMALPKWRHDAASLSIEDTAIIARSPYYPQWRSEVEKAFVRIDEGVEQAHTLPNYPRLLICMLPPGLPITGEPWPSLDKPGRQLTLDRPFGETAESLLRSVAGRTRNPGLDEIEATWILECSESFRKTLEDTSAVSLSWSSLEVLRRKFLDRLNAIQKSLRSADETNQELKRMDIGKDLDASIARDVRIREFLRSLLLSGNGSLVFSNSFVQWGASETLRRVQPQVLLASFGIRSKVKPFSGVVLFEDQQRSNPVSDEPDLPGSLVDCVKLSEYVFLAAQRLAPYRDRTVTIFGIADLDRILIVEPGSVVAPSGKKLSGDELASPLLQWLQGGK